MSTCAESSARGGLTAPQRNNYFYGKLLDELHLTMEQQYVNGKRRTLNRLALGWGVLCGLQVTTDDKTLRLDSGVAVDGLGREIVVPGASIIDPWLAADSCGATTALDPTVSHKVYLVLSYCERRSDPMPVLVTDCETDDSCAPSTIVEGFRAYTVVGDAPPANLASEALCKALNGGTTADEKRRAICQILTSASSPCTAPDGQLGVVLATMFLTANGQVVKLDPITNRNILCSNEMLFQLLLCLRGEQGEKGDKGDKGEQGVEGVPGPAGPGLDPNLGKISYINWPHNGTLALQDLLPWATGKSGPMLTFNEKIVPSALPSDGAGWIAVSVEYQAPQLGWTIPWFVRAQEVRLADQGNPTISTVTFVLPPIFYALFRFIMGELRQERALVRIRLNCDHLRTDSGQIVDGSFRDASGTLAAEGYKVESGDGVQGGCFESWFYLTPKINGPGSDVIDRVTDMTSDDMLRAAYFLPRSGN